MLKTKKSRNTFFNYMMILWHIAGMFFSNMAFGVPWSIIFGSYFVIGTIVLIGLNAGTWIANGAEE